MIIRKKYTVLYIVRRSGLITAHTWRTVNVWLTYIVQQVFCLNFLHLHTITFAKCFMLPAHLLQLWIFFCLNYKNSGEMFECPHLYSRNDSSDRGFYPTFHTLHNVHIQARKERMFFTIISQFFYESIRKGMQIWSKNVIIKKHIVNVLVVTVLLNWKGLQVLGIEDHILKIFLVIFSFFIVATELF